MKIVIDIPDSIYDNIKSHGDNICDNFIISLTRVHDRSAIEVFRAIQNGKPYVDSKEIHIDKPRGYTLKSIHDKMPEQTKEPVGHTKCERQQMFGCNGCLMETKCPWRPWEHMGWSGYGK